VASWAAGGGRQDGVPPTQHFVGVVRDAATGAALGGARVRAAAFHGESHPSVAGFPALETLLTRARDNGEIWLPALRPEDPRLRIHLQVDAPGRPAEVAVLSGRRSFAGPWNDVEVELRRVQTGRILVVDAEGAPLPDIALRVSAFEDGFDFLMQDLDVRLASRDLVREGLRRLVATKGARLLYTDATGSLELPWSDHPFEVELLAPTRFLSRVGLTVLDALERRVEVYLDPEGPLVLVAVRVPQVSQRLLDRDGTPVRVAEVEMGLDAFPPVRFFTDEEGVFPVALPPRPAGEPPLSAVHPRQAWLRVLAPTLYDRRVTVAFPTATRTLFVPKRRARRLRMRFVEASAKDPLPVLPVGVVLSADLALVRLDADGTVEFEGALPPEGGPLGVHVQDFLPREVILPEDPGAPRIDLGEVRLERGWSREFHVHFLRPPAPAEDVHADFEATLGERIFARGVRLLVGFDSASFPGLVEEQVYRVPLDGRLRVGGLRPGAYTLGVEGPDVETFSGRFHIDDTLSPQVYEVHLEASEEELVRVSGSVVGADLHGLASTRVVERYRVRGQERPVTFPPYALAPGGGFGSARRLSGVSAVQVVLVGPESTGAEVGAPRWPDKPPSFRFDPVALLPTARAEVAFHVPGLGAVRPPQHVAVAGADGIETIARLGAERRRLVVENLRAGEYQLQWLAGDGAVESLALEIPSTKAKVKVDVERSPLPEEVVYIRIVDEGGRPILGARLSPRLRAGPWEASNQPGLYPVRVHFRRTTKFRIESRGFLPARVEVPAGGVFPTEVTLYRPVPVRGHILDADGLPFDGDLVTSWRAVTPGPVSHGVPLEVRVEQGHFRAEFPPLPRRYSFQAVGTVTSFGRHFTPAFDGDAAFDLGTIRLQESRSFVGRVFLPDGRPAAAATVAVVESGKAYRFPLRKPHDLRQEAFSTATDAQGHFRLEGLPLALAGSLALVGRLDGHGDSILDPVELDLPGYDLQLLASTRLEIDVGYADGESRDAYRFALEFVPDPSRAESVFELGEILPTLHEVHRYEGIEPGRYRLRWGLRESYTPFPGLWQEVEAGVGMQVALHLRLEGRTLRGRARFNGRALRRGWILITDDPSGGGGTWVGRVVDGSYTVLDPPQTFEAFGAVIPEGEPLPTQNIERGEALPVRLPRYSGSLRRGRLNFDYEAFTMTLRFDAEFLADHPGAWLSYDGYVWDERRYRRRRREVLIEDRIVRFQLLPRGQHSFGVVNQRGNLVQRWVVDLTEDREILVR